MGRLPRRHAKDVGQMVAAGPRPTPGRRHAFVTGSRDDSVVHSSFLRRLRASQHNEPTKATAQFAGRAVGGWRFGSLPINYSPKTSIRFINLASYEVSTEDVTTVVIDEQQAASVAIDAAIRRSRQRRPPGSSCATPRVVTRPGPPRSSRVQSRHDRGRRRLRDETGPNIFAPIFKFSSVPPHTLLSYNLVGRPALLRVATLRKIRDSIRTPGWAFEHDAYLRLREADAIFRHVNLVLPAARPDISFERRTSTPIPAVTEKALARRGWPGSVKTGPGARTVELELDAPSPQPSIDVIIPTRAESIWCATASRRSKTRRPTRTGTSSCSTMTRSSRNPSSTSRTPKYRVVAVSRTLQLRQDRQSRGRALQGRFRRDAEQRHDLVTRTGWSEWCRFAGVAGRRRRRGVPLGPVRASRARGHRHLAVPAALRTDSNYPHLDQYSRSTRDVAAVTGAVQRPGENSGIRSGHGRTPGRHHE